MQIVQAADLEALKAAAQQITRLIALLDRGGTKVSQIAKLVQELNAKLFERAWQMIAPAALAANSCLFVMGSEGRGEQLLKTDQDNGLVLRDGFPIDEAELAAVCERFSAALGDSATPYARPHHAQQPGVATSRKRLRRGCASLAAAPGAREPDGARHLSRRACRRGRRLALAAVRGEVDRLVASNDACSGASPARSTSFRKRAPARGGIGCSRSASRTARRSTSRSRHLSPGARRAQPVARAAHRRHQQPRAARSAGRCRTAVAAATDLADALQFLMALKLRAGLAELDTGRPVSGGVRLDRLRASSATS